MSLSSSELSASIAVSDAEKATEFYEGKLGLSPVRVQADGSRVYGSIASGAINSGRPSEWPKPGRSIATTRAAPDTRSQILRYAQRLSGHGLNINTVTARESALLSANRIRTPSHTRKSGEIVVVARSLSSFNGGSFGC
jgi:catechol 2,3-dioxygenase-like lactoylglutathione lyase family enzyme